MKYEDEFRKVLKKNFQSRASEFRKNGTNAYRIYDQNTEGIPWAVDIYNESIHILDYASTDEKNYNLETLLDIVSRLTYVKRDSIVFKTRKARAEDDQHVKIDGQSREIVIRENQLEFSVNLHDYIDTGLFLDHRKSREMIRDVAMGKRVLNLFSYTGSFSVYAGAGQASRVVSVDMSNTYSEWARRNWALNDLQFAVDSEFRAEDVFTFLENQKKGGWDIIVLDPPSFSNSRKTSKILRIEKDYSSLINHCLGLLNRGGFLFFSTNLRTFNLDKKKIRSGKIRSTTYQTLSREFRKKTHQSWIFEK